jgi:HEAT repeat protein
MGEVVRRKRIFIVLAVCVLVGIGVVAFWPGEREPEYNGKKLSAWLRSVSLPAADPMAKKEACEAIDHIGTNALPCVVHWLSYKTPRWKTYILAGGSKMPRPFRPVTDWVLKKMANSDYGHLSRMLLGAECLRVLGSKAEPAVPKLVRLSNSPDMRVARFAIHGLAQIAELGRKPLTEIIEDPSHPHRDFAVTAFAMAPQSRGADFDHALARVVCDPDTKVARGAALALGQSKSRPDIALPALSRAAADPRTTVRSMAVFALGMLGETARPVVPVILNACTDTESAVRYGATNALRRVAPELLPQELREIREAVE